MGFYRKTEIKGPKSSLQGATEKWIAKDERAHSFPLFWRRVRERRPYLRIAPYLIDSAITGFALHARPIHLLIPPDF